MNSKFLHSEPGRGGRPGFERTGPPDGGLARVAPTGRVAAGGYAGGAWQTNDAANRRISRRIGGDGPAGVSTTAGRESS